MSGRTIIIELHGWRGLHIEGGPLGRVLIVGFASVCYAPFLVREWITQKIGALRNVAGESRGFVEMACVGEDRCERINGGKPLHVRSVKK